MEVAPSLDKKMTTSDSDSIRLIQGTETNDGYYSRVAVLFIISDYVANGIA